MSRQIDIKALVSHVVKGDGADKCRICMGDTSEGQVYLGDTVMVDGNKAVTLAELLETITGVQVQMISALPNYLCKSCYNGFYRFMPFLRLCRQSARRWSEIINYIDNINIKQTKLTKTLFLIVKPSGIETVTERIRKTENRVNNPKEALRKLKKTMQQSKWKRKRYMYEQMVEANKIPMSLRCEDCGKAFVLPYKYNKHIKDTKKKLCTYCNHVCWKEDLQYHLRSVHNKKVYSCKICYETYFQATSLRRHVKLKHKNGSYICSECKDSFQSYSRLTLHMKRHQMKYCSGCNKIFTNSPCQFYHMSKCTKLQEPNKKVTKYICNYCSKVYERKHSLKLHIKLFHLKQHKFQCESCGKKLQSTTALLEHSNKHKKVPDRYVCNICNANFSTRRGYERHLKKHLGNSTLNQKERRIFKKMS